MNKNHGFYVVYDRCEFNKHKNYMTKNIKLLLNTLPISFILLTLTGCSSDNSANGEQSINNSDNNDGGMANQQIAEKTLAIAEYKCTGCGKCVRIDPEHFSIDSANRKALIVSDNNLNSQNLAIAISICRDQAIELL